MAPQDEMEVLGVTYDRGLAFKTLTERLNRDASRKLASLRRMAWLLDSKGAGDCKAQVHFFLEYVCLACGGGAKKRLALLGKVQDQAARLIRDSGTGQEPHLYTFYVSFWNTLLDSQRNFDGTNAQSYKVFVKTKLAAGTCLS